jgi:hypothetical protein
MNEWIVGGLALVALVFLTFDWMGQDVTVEQAEDRRRRFK